MAENKEKTFAGEQLDLEQLGEVSGGSCKELSQDSSGRIAAEEEGHYPAESTADRMLLLGSQPADLRPPRRDSLFQSCRTVRIRIFRIQ